MGSRRSPGVPTAKKPESDAPRGSESARRVLQLLLSFSEDRHTQTAAELSRSTGLPIPTLYRYLGLLRDAGLLVTSEGGFHLSTRFIGLAQAAEAAEPLTRIADPVMQELGRSTGETVLLVRLIERSAVCVHRVESTHRLRISFEPGYPLPLERGASAKVLMASLSLDQLDAQLSPLRRRDAAAAEELAREVALTRERGWATSDAEIDQGVWAVAAAVRDGNTVAALSVPSPIFRTSASTRRTTLLRVTEAADEISRRARNARSGDAGELAL